MLPPRQELGARAKDLLTSVVWPRKWAADSRSLPLEAAHKTLYEQVHKHCLRAIRRYPRLVNPRDYTDKLQWLKLFDQDELKVVCCDKALVKEYGASIVGEQYFAETYQVSSSFSGLNLKSLPANYVLKATHDSGTVRVVEGNDVASDELRKLFTSALSELYGWEKGEWCYSLLDPKVIAEERLGAGSGGIADYKFHCVDGEVAWLQYIYDRNTVPKESLAERDGQPLALEFSPNLVRGGPFVKPRGFEHMTEIAEAMASPFRYVRVDMYLVEERPYVGELTFYPLSGCYTGVGQRILGERLTFDRSTVKPPVVSERGIRTSVRGSQGRAEK